jgi:hypothetical protein
MRKGDFEAFQSSYVSKTDVQDGPLQLVIKSVEEGEVQGDGQKEKKPILFARNHDKGLILNNTNWDTLEAAYGEDSDDWTGKKIEVYFDPTISFGGKKTGGLRVRAIQTPQRPQGVGAKTAGDPSGGLDQLPDRDPNLSDPPF